MNATTEQTFKPDTRGLVCACPNCGRRNRLLFERLGHAFQCAHCHKELPPPASPLEVPGAAEFDALVARSAQPVLVDFWAPWCGPCKMVAPELAKAAAERAGLLVVAKVNTDEQQDVAARFAIRAIPTMILFKAGREAKRQAGAMSAPAILQFLQQTP